MTRTRADEARVQFVAPASRRLSRARLALAVDPGTNPTSAILTSFPHEGALRQPARGGNRRT